ncbi:MAG: type II secretion system F family protein [Candidatus Nanopelagicales bacterium]|jgi:tight adherence protein C
MGSVWFPVVASLLVFLAIIVIGVRAQQYKAESSKRRSLAMVSGYASANVSEAIAQVEQRDSIIRTSVLSIGYRLVPQKSRDKLAARIVQSGDTRGATVVDEQIIKKVEFGLVGLLLGLLLGFASGGLAWLAVPAFALGGFYVTDLLLYNKVLKRDEEMAKRLPDALDMLNLCVESGLSFAAALGQVAANQTGAVAEEFAIALQEMQYGRSRAEALTAMAGRTKQEDVERFVSAMLQVDKLGVPVATVLREQAKEMRAKRYSRAREQAQKVPVKILMPLMLCFLPALFIIILGPAAFSIAEVFSNQ